MESNQKFIYHFTCVKWWAVSNSSYIHLSFPRQIKIENQYLISLWNSRFSFYLVPTHLGSIWGPSLRLWKKIHSVELGPHCHISEVPLSLFSLSLIKTEWICGSVKGHHSGNRTQATEQNPSTVKQTRFLQQNYKFFCRYTLLGFQYFISKEYIINILITKWSISLVHRILWVKNT
jgi:hypothetical protein